MIGYIDVEVNAANPQMPLCPFYSFVGSPSNVRVHNVPGKIGNWAITKVFVSVAYPDNSIASSECTRIGDVYVATLAACATVGASAKGFQITADGIDERGNAVTGYVLGIGDAFILDRDGSITVGETTYYFHLLDAAPTTPKKGDVFVFSGVCKYYDGTAWQPFAKSVAVVPPSTNPADSGKAADAKATGEQLALRPTKSQIDAGWWSEWVLTGDNPPDGYRWSVSFNDDGYWSLGLVSVSDGSYLDLGCDVDGPIDATYIDYSGFSYDFDDDTLDIDTLTATRHRVASPVPTKPSDIGAQAALTFDTTPTANSTNPVTSGGIKTALDAKASTADATLTPVYGGNGERFGAWSISPPTYDGNQISLGYEDDGRWYFYYAGGAAIGYEGVDGLPDDLSVTLEYGGVTYSAVRSVNPVVGYTLGSQSDKPLQPQGAYAPATNIPKTALAQDVQTSLGLADTAVQPSALPGAVRYDLPANATAISSASSEVVEGETVTYGEATLADRTGNRVSITATLDELRVTFPPAVSGKVRDFGLRVEVGTGSAALTAPALVPPAGVTLENADGAIPALADGTATAKGVTLLYFSETAPGVFVVKGEQVEEVA